MVFLASLELSLLLTKNSSKCRRRGRRLLQYLDNFTSFFKTWRNFGRDVYVLKKTESETKQRFFENVVWQKVATDWHFLWCFVGKVNTTTQESWDAKQITNKEANLSEEKIKSAQKWFDMHFEVQDNSMFFHSKAVLREQQ